tara:strand:+ start:785 stop:1789 length:1005 start_codon:yes stop_codon:yes gene_type:complete
MLKSLSFEDVLLIPQFSDIVSRKEVDISTNLGGKINLDIPIISSPMDTVTENLTAVEMYNQGGLGVIHRYNSIEEQAALVKSCNGATVGAAVGVSGDYIERTCALRDAGVKVICVDIAHGHHALMRHALKTLRNTFGNSIHIMAGNVATLEGFNDLADWGADSIRVGIGGGSICSTRIQTGHGIPTFQSILDCSRSDRNVGLIADGGIRTSGDIVKALAAGADAVILGSLLAGTNESPGENIYRDGRSFKAYRGMASVEAQIDWRGHTASVEGVSSLVPCKGDLRAVLKGLCTGIRSGFSYTGARSLIEMQSMATFIQQTSAGAAESSTHINNR